MLNAKTFVFTNSFPNYPSNNIYDTIITKVMNGMDDKLKAAGFDIDQINEIERLWRERLRELEMNDESDDNTMQQDSVPSAPMHNDIYSAHIGTLNNHMYSLPSRFVTSEGLHDYPEDSFNSKGDRQLHESLAFQDSHDPMMDYDRNEQHDDDSLSDLTDDDDENETEYESKMFCLFNYVKHSQGRHRCEFTHCVLRNGKKEYFFGKCMAEIESA